MTEILIHSLDGNPLHIYCALSTRTIGGHVEIYRPFPFRGQLLAGNEHGHHPGVRAEHHTHW